MKLVGLNTLMRVLTVLKTSFKTLCRVLPRAMVQRRTIPRSASRARNLGVTFPHGRPPVLLFLASFHRHERGSDIS
jgi:hypothetical protein